MGPSTSTRVRSETRKSEEILAVRWDRGKVATVAEAGRGFRRWRRVRIRKRAERVPRVAANRWGAKVRAAKVGGRVEVLMERRAVTVLKVVAMVPRDGDTEGTRVRSLI